MKLLVAEDWYFILVDLSGIAEEFGMTTFLATSVAEATAHVRSKGIEAALLDIELKDGTTYALARELQERKIPFAFVTGASGTDFAEIAQDWPGVLVISKPFSVPAIQSALEGFKR